MVCFVKIWIRRWRVPPDGDSPPAPIVDCGSVQKGLRGDEGVEESVAFDAALKVAQVDENETDGHVGPNVKALHFAAHLVFDFAADFVLAFGLDHEGRSRGLYQQVDLANSPISRLLPMRRRPRQATSEAVDMCQSAARSSSSDSLPKNMACPPFLMTERSIP